MCVWKTYACVRLCLPLFIYPPLQGWCDVHNITSTAYRLLTYYMSKDGACAFSQFTQRLGAWPVLAERDASVQKFGSPSCHSRARCRTEYGNSLSLLCVCVCVCARACVCVCLCVFLQGLPAPVAERLGDWCFHDIKSVKLHVSNTMDTQEQLAALPAILNHLRDLEAPGATVSVQYREDCKELRSALKKAKTTLRHLKVVSDPYKPPIDYGMAGVGVSAHACVCVSVCVCVCVCVCTYV